MTHAWKTMVAAAALLAIPTVADAQTCTGLAPFSAGRVQLGASADFGKDAQAFTGSFTVGSPAGAFGGVLIGTVSYDETDDKSTGVGGQLGWQFPIGTGGGVELCPVGGVVYSFADDVGGSGTDVSTWNFVFGLQLGVRAGANPQFGLVPTVGAALAYTKAEYEGFLNFEDDETFGILSLGLGFIVISRVSILPSIEIPVGLDDSDPVYGIMAAVNF